MIAAKASTDDMLAKAEPLIRRSAARMGELPGMGYEDLCQELRICVVKLADGFDPTRQVPWMAYLSQQLPLRCVDIARACGTWTRSGKHRRSQRHYSLDFNSEECQPLDPPCPGEELPELEWGDLIERAESEPQQVRALIWWASGLTMREIGLRLGLSESRVSRIISPQHPTFENMRARICVLLGVDGRRRVVTNQPGRN